MHTPRLAAMDCVHRLADRISRRGAATKTLNPSKNAQTKLESRQSGGGEAAQGFPDESVSEDSELKRLERRADRSAIYMEVAAVNVIALNGMPVSMLSREISEC